MKVLACGGRTYADYNAIHARIAQLPSDTILIHGDARGADRLAGDAAARHGLEVWAVPAEWDRYGKSAGIKRNLAMLALHPDLVLAWPGGVGTAHMVRIASQAGIPVERL